mmetsp:Transcript_3464/g.2928  ORF Transcript_3464/g.2928 Transcript_3464/m.2928 type:complete len:236 (+) Transcript_3464:511-1218(+)
MFVIGGSNNIKNKVEQWGVLQRAGPEACVFEDLLIDSSLTGWEILTDYWKTIRKFTLGHSRIAHVSVAVANEFIYSIGGKDQKSAKSIERYEIDNNSSLVSELHFPRYYASACSFSDRFIYIYGGYSHDTSSLLNKIERIDHFSPEVSPLLYELDQSDLPALVGSIIQQYDKSTILILGGKSKKFSKKIYFFDCDDLSVKTENTKTKNQLQSRNIYNYQSDSVITENEQGKDRKI